MPSVTINGQQFEFTPGETIIKVSTRAGIEIPYYCWHPRLSVAANCRMCLVEVEKAPKLLPACQTECRDGMVVHTDNDTAKAAQRAVQEFMLINHPIDCPICDQAGECKLQDYYMEFHLQGSRMQERKVRQVKHQRLGPYVVYDGERCILCTRCVRFTEEIAGEKQLGIFQRGDRAVIGTFPEQELDNPYSLNTVDICPVGALTSSLFRFKQRVWNLQRSDSLCGGCARGCNVHADHRSGLVYRMLPRENEEVNKSWLCDAGRLTFQNANQHRLTTCLLRTGSADSPQETDDRGALRHAAKLLRPIVEARVHLGVALSLHATCEEAYLLGRLCKEALGVERIALLGHEPWQGDDFLTVPDRNPNRAGVERVCADLGLTTQDFAGLRQDVSAGEVKALIVVGHEFDTPEDLAALIANLEVVVHVAHAKTPLAQMAHVTLPSLPWVQLDGTWINVDGRGQRLVPGFEPSGAACASHVWLARVGSELGLAFAAQSPQSIRAEMMETLPSFRESRLTQLGALGHHLG